MIARNEEQLLPGCLESVKGVVDEVVLVDTGSTDKTVALARQAGARIIEQAWKDDFAAPRNAALQAATGEWVLQLDADERLTPNAGKAIRKALARADFACGMIRLHDATRMDAGFEDIVSGRARIADPIYLPRLLKKTPYLEYRGLVHESVGGWLERQGMKLKYLEVDVIHFGNVPSLRQGKAKGQRNIELLFKRCALEPDSVTAFGYLALELLKAGDRERAWDVVNQGWAIAQRTQKNPSVLRLADARATLQLEKGDAHGVLETLAFAETVDGPQPDFAYLRGCALELIGMRSPSATRARGRLLEESLSCFAQAQKPRTAPGLAQFMDGVSGWSALTHQGTALLALGRYVEARRAFSAALALNPASLEAQVGLAEALLECGDAKAGLAACERTLGADPDGWLIAAACAEALGSVKDLQLLFSETCKRTAKGFLSIHRNERHAELACLVSLSLGRAIAGPGTLGVITGVLARAPMPLEVHKSFAPALAKVVRVATVSGHAQLLEPLFEPRGTAMFPKIIEALAALGVRATATEPSAASESDTPAVVVPNVWARDWLQTSVHAPMELRLDDTSHAIRVRELTLDWAALKADPVTHIRKLMARLGAADDDTLLRRLIEEYPGANA